MPDDKTVTVRKEVNRPKVIGALLLMIGVPVTCTAGTVANEAKSESAMVWFGLLLVCLFAGLGFFVVGRLRE